MITIIVAQNNIKEKNINCNFKRNKLTNTHSEQTKKKSSHKNTILVRLSLSLLAGVSSSLLTGGLLYALDNNKDKKKTQAYKKVTKSKAAVLNQINQPQDRIHNKTLLDHLRDVNLELYKNSNEAIREKDYIEELDKNTELQKELQKIELALYGKQDETPEIEEHLRDINLQLYKNSNEAIREEYYIEKLDKNTELQKELQKIELALYEKKDKIPKIESVEK